MVDCYYAIMFLDHTFTHADLWSIVSYLSPRAYRTKDRRWDINMAQFHKDTACIATKITGRSLLAQRRLNAGWDDVAIFAESALRPSEKEGIEVEVPQSGSRPRDRQQGWHTPRRSEQRVRTSIPQPVVATVSVSITVSISSSFTLRPSSVESCSVQTRLPGTLKS